MDTYIHTHIKYTDYVKERDNQQRIPGSDAMRVIINCCVSVKKRNRDGKTYGQHASLHDNLCKRL